MHTLLELRRHRFDAMHDFLTGQHPARVRQSAGSRSIEARLCIAVGLAACVALIGLAMT
ncbi:MULTISPECIES: hypothetical protein [Marivita]|uniref:Uncharacterized protein n=1 Tax=Marivita cryptomonadis TaxID=505252 RepID=A0A9Q2NXJ0_9RHOB|nr:MULTISPECIES: hypothetical protein [Marivita]MCR9167230.1 hypothetical protein [Paracoccaceae bacterium]MBM2320543.1 hypothetical protein [Marivita cryptomonadis]MBM2330123.1 hypothetical protein [Marivita cryptomonadis]MBM2339710.1 hypothetical protein [Marivita cryptomonadis]MBM2344369.1 hypothetical protein [Marivita cryptomonadis]